MCQYLVVPKPDNRLECSPRAFPSSGRILFLTSEVCIRYGTAVHLSEARAMSLWQRLISVLLPKVYCSFESFQRKGITYILMERTAGTLSVGKETHFLNLKPSKLV